jgi:uncharacterized protein
VIEVRLRGDLADLAGEPVCRVPPSEPRSVKDLVESLGIPHTEIAQLTVDGSHAGFARLVEDGEVVDVDPVDMVRAAPLQDTPPPPTRFVADVHLGRLAGMLRLLGLDTLYENEADDGALVELAVTGGRVLLTRDRGLLKRSAVVHGCLVRSTDPQAQLRQVSYRYDLGGQLIPLSRCARCNGILATVDKSEVVEQLEPGTRRDHDRFVRCTSCSQIYWSGSHRGRLAEIVEIARAAGS